MQDYLSLSGMSDAVVDGDYCDSSHESVDCRLDLHGDARLTRGDSTDVDREERMFADYGDSDVMLSEIPWEWGVPTYLTAPRPPMTFVANAPSLLRGRRRLQAHRRRITSVRARLWAMQMAVTALRPADVGNGGSEHDSESTRVSTTPSLTPSVISESESSATDSEPSAVI